MERVGTVSRSDRKSRMLQGPKEDHSSFSSNKDENTKLKQPLPGGTLQLTPAVTNTTNHKFGWNTGIHRGQNRRKTQHAQAIRSQICPSPTLAKKGLHPIVSNCEALANQILKDTSVPPTYNTIKSQLVGKWGMLTFKENKPLIVAVLAKLVPEHAEHRDITRVSKIRTTSRSKVASSRDWGQRRRSFQEFNTNLMRIYSRLQEVFTPHTSIEDFQKLSEIWNALSNNNDRPCSLSDPQWIKLGCPTRDPASSFTEAGKLAVDCLLGMIHEESKAFEKIKQDVNYAHNHTLYPLIEVVMELTLRLCIIFGLATFQTKKTSGMSYFFQKQYH